MHTKVARRSNGLGALLLFTAVYLVLPLGSRCSEDSTPCVQITAEPRDLWTSTGGLPRDLALVVADEPQEDAGGFFTKARATALLLLEGCTLQAQRQGLCRSSAGMHGLLDAKPRAHAGLLRMRLQDARPPWWLPSCLPCASRLRLGQTWLLP